MALSACLLKVIVCRRKGSSLPSPLNETRCVPEDTKGKKLLEDRELGTITEISGRLPGLSAVHHRRIPVTSPCDKVLEGAITGFSPVDYYARGLHQEAELIPK